MSDSRDDMSARAGWGRRLIEFFYWVEPPKWLKRIASGSTHIRKLNTLNHTARASLRGLLVLISISGSLPILWPWLYETLGRDLGTNAPPGLAVVNLVLSGVMIPIVSTIYAYAVVERATLSKVTIGTLESEVKLHRFLFGNDDDGKGGNSKVVLYLPDFKYEPQNATQIYADAFKDKDFTGSKNSPPVLSVDTGRFDKVAAFRDVSAASEVIAAMEHHFGRAVAIEAPERGTTVLPGTSRLNICIGLFSNQYSLNVLNKVTRGPIPSWTMVKDYFEAYIHVRGESQAAASVRYGIDGRRLDGDAGQATDYALIVRWYDSETESVWIVLGGFQDLGTHAGGRNFSETLVSRVLSSYLGARSGG
jgi:hypothetical protein